MHMHMHMPIHMSIRMLCTHACTHAYAHVSKHMSILMSMHMWNQTEEATKIHDSETCLVIVCVDVRKRCRVALKLMAHKEQWTREKDMRQVGDGMLDGSHIVEILDSCELYTKALAYCAEHDELQSDTGTVYPFLIVMPAAQLDLSYELSHSQTAGGNLDGVVDLMRQVGTHLQYMHVHGRIHGDLKARNIVKVIINRSPSWLLIDLDNSCCCGTPAANKVTSSCNFPPELARRELYRGQASGQPELVVASENFDIWYFGLLLLQLSTKNAPTVWRSDQADNITEESDMHSLAYYWDVVKLNIIGRMMKKADQKWVPAADLVLYCLQANAARRPQSMEQVFQHKLFNPDGELHFFLDSTETWEAFVQRQAAELHAAIKRGDSVKVQEMFSCSGAVHINMAVTSIAASAVLPLHAAAFSGKVEVVQVLLAEISDAWPSWVKKEVLDCQPEHSYTPYMIACECGFTDVAELLVRKGCSTDLVNMSSKTGKQLADAVAHEQEWSAHRHWDRGDRLHLGAKDLESHLDFLQRAHKSEDASAGWRLWNSKLLVSHLNNTQMRALEASIESLMKKNLSTAVSCMLFISSIQINCIPEL